MNTYQSTRIMNLAELDADVCTAGTPSKGPSGQREGPATAEEGRGPHVSLAVRLKRRDGDRQFHIGERIPYVLVSGRGKLQVRGLPM